MLRRPQRTLTLVWALWGALVVASPSDARFLVSGSQQDRATWNQMLQQCSNASTSFRNLVSKISGSRTKTVRIVLVRNVASVVVDQAPVAGAGRNANKVDLSDIEDLAELDPPKVVDRCQIIAHFLEERWQLACGTTFKTAHLAGIDAENAWRADRGYTDRISKAPVSGGWIGHGPSSDGKKACHFWTDGDTTYDPIPGERTETGVFAHEVEPGVLSVSTSTDSGNRDVTYLPQALGGERVETSFFASMLVEVGAPVGTGAFRYADLTLLSVEGDAPPVSLPMPPFSTGVNHFALDPSLEQRGVLNLDNGQIWLTYYGRITNDLYPASAPLGTYSMLTGIVDPADLVVEDSQVRLDGGMASFEVRTSAALLDGEAIELWSHYPNADCNGNGAQDVLEIAGDPGLDDGGLCGLGGGNHYFDACDCGDCNGNGVADVLDLDSGAATDCNVNGLPDGCDLASGLSMDADGNAIPDECEGLVDPRLPADSPGEGFDTGDTRPCVEDDTTLCLAGDRYEVRAEWATPQGTRGAGKAVELTPDTGYFWFFDAANVEMVLKVLDVCAASFERFWVFAGGLTNVEVEITVRDTFTGLGRRYLDPQATAFQPILDTQAFATCP